MNRIEMSERELRRLEVLSRVSGGGVSQVQTGMELSLTARQVRRLQRRYEAKGAAGLLSGHRSGSVILLIASGRRHAIIST